VKIERRGPDSELNMRYFKIPLCRIFTEKRSRLVEVKRNVSVVSWVKNWGWQMPLFKFLRPEIWRWNLWFDGSKRLKYRVHHFWPKMLWNAGEMLVM